MQTSLGSWKLQRGSGRPPAYYLAKGTRVASVTTITGARKSGAEPLQVWYYNSGYEDGVEGVPPDPKRRLTQAANAGSLAHHMVENVIHGRDEMEGVPEVPFATLQQAKQGLTAFQDWSRVMQVEYVLTETPMVSEKYAYGGTPDAIGHVDGKLALLDWKTGNRVYADAIIQMAAYRHLWLEVHAEKHGPIEANYLLRFGKEHGDYHVHAYPDSVMELGWEAFLHLRELYQLDKDLGKAAT